MLVPVHCGRPLSYGGNVTNSTRNNILLTRRAHARMRVVGIALDADVPCGKWIC